LEVLEPLPTLINKVPPVKIAINAKTLNLRIFLPALHGRHHPACGFSSMPPGL
jgi:hypothetical protein